MEKNFEGLADSANEKPRDVIDKGDNNKTNNKKENIVIKSEITIEPEEITQMHMSYDYDFRQTNENILQVEIYADSENFAEKDDILLPQNSASAINTNSEKTIMEKLEDTNILSDVMSDHNYTSQELVESESNIGNIRGHLLNRLLSQRSSSDNVSKQVRAFVDKTVDAIELFETDVLCSENVSEKYIDMLEKSDISLDNRYKFVTGKHSNLSEDESQDEKSTILASTKLERLESNDDVNTECSLPPDCSEPMEFEPSADLLIDLNEDKATKLSKSNKFLKLVMEFAKTLYNDCGTFMSATTDVDDKVALYLKAQMHKFKTIAIGENCVEKATQTENRTTSKKKRMNYKAKQKLIADCIYSSDTDSESSSVSSRSSCTTPDSTKSFCTKKEETTENLSKHDTVNNAQEYDDGIDISKYIQSDIFDSVFPNSPPVQSESDKENKKHKLESSGDDTDKEIDRLTNLSGLSKRQPFTSTKYTQSDKQKSKTLCQKNNNIIDFSDDETENQNSNKSILENEEEIITENEFKSRCNADVKRQLLNDSSSDSDEPEHSDNDLANKLTSDEEGAGNSLLVDKFLETYTVDLSDADDGAEEFEAKSNKTTKSAENESQGSDCVKENNDYDFLNENLEHKRKGKSKTLEKMLLEAEKRNSNGNEEIVLSSESDYSDVEAVDVEPVEEKSRVIKAMLRPDQLANETRKAQKLENERTRKLEKQQSILAKALKQHSDQVAKGEVILDYLEDSKIFIKVDPAIVVHLKPHQIDGVKFMYESCYCGAISSAKNPGSGCILAHCMGLGKTLQLIALIHTVVSYPQLKTNKVLVLCPKSTVMNWADEMQRWLGPYQKDKHLKVFVFTEPSDISEKLQVLEEWAASTSKRAGCLLLGYEAFRTLVFYHSYKSRINLSPQRLQEIKDKIDKFLLEPGADLAVCDEGHIIKNSKSAISLAVARIKTPRRIILTGTPIQNNLKEYYSMVNFIKPLYLGTEKEFANLYANPIKNGQHKDSNKQDIKVMKQRSFVLHKKLSKFVQRKEAELLKTFLPSKFEYVLFVPMTLVQRRLYEHIIGAISTRGDNRGKSLITDYTCLRKIWTHPKVLQDAWKNATDQKIKNDARKAQAQASAGHSDDDQPDDIYDSQTGVMSVTNDWWRHLLTNKDLETIMPSNKMRAMFEILRMCEEKGEKCLIFSAFVAVLNVVEYFFNKITNKDPEMLQQISFASSQKVSNVWISGQDYYRLDGKTPKAIRHEMIKRFNSPTNMRARVFLISSKAGGQGINLTGANRVIILDTSWNPSNDQQNIFRIFRLGQKRICYIYRLLAMGTMEEKVYSRSVTKQAMSFRVVDEQQIDRHYNMAELAELYSLTDIKDSDRPMPILPKDSILASLLMNHPDVVYKYHEHDSLLENKVEQELSEQEKSDAWATYERELQMNMETQEAPNMDRMQNNLFASKMPNYNGSIPGLDMQALLNYGMFSSQAPLMSSFPTNYATSANQYLEALYRNFSLGYPELTPPLHGSNPYGPPYSSVNQSPKALTAANMNAMHVVPTTPNPLTALSDLGMLGTHAQKIYNNPAVSVPPLHAGHVNSYPATSMQSNTNMSLSTKNLNAQYGPYGPVHRSDNSHQSYFNFVNEFSGLLNPLSNAALSGAAAGTQQSALDLPQPTNLQKAASAVQESLATHPLNLNSKQAPVVDKIHQKEKVAATASPTDYMSLSTKKPENAQKDLTSSNVNQAFLNPIQAKQSASLGSLTQKTPTPTSLPASTTPTASKRPATNFATYSKTVAAQRPKNVTPNTNVNVQKKPPNMQSVSDKAVNIGIRYPQLKENNTTAKSTDFMKSNSEMQIIPTTSPPGTSSISKQFLEISPSISLTAVRNSNTKTLPPSASTGANAGVGASAKQTIQKQNFNMPISKGNNNVSANGLIISKAVNKTGGPKGVSVVTPNTSGSGGGFTPTSLKSVTSGVSVTAKAAAASMVLAKATGAMANVKPADVHKMPANLPATGMKMRTTAQKVNVGGIMANLNVQSLSSVSANKDSNLNSAAVYGGTNESLKKVNLITNNPKVRNLVTTKASTSSAQKEGLSSLPSKSLTTTSLDMRGMSIKSGTVAGLAKVYDRKRNGDEIKHLIEAKSQKLSHEPK